MGIGLDLLSMHLNQNMRSNLWIEFFSKLAKTALELIPGQANSMVIPWLYNVIDKKLH